MRKPNTKINGEALDAAIRKAEGTRYNQSKISTIIMGKGRAYYCQCIRENQINDDVLTKVCEFYDLDKADFIITEAIEKSEQRKSVDNTNYENIILLLTSIDKTLNELLAQQKSTQYTLQQTENAVRTGNGHLKATLELLQAQEKRKQNYHNTTSKLRSVN